MSIIPTQEPIAQVEVANDSTIAIEGILRRQIERRDEYKQVIKAHRESIKNLLTNDLDYCSAEELAKANAKELKAQRQRVLSGAEAMQISFKIKEQQAQLKELDESINNHYSSFEKVTGQLILCDVDGTPMIEAKKQYKLKKAKKREE